MRAALCIAAWALGALLAPAVSSAATASISNGTLVYTAGNNETNSITVFVFLLSAGGPRIFEIEDSGATITAGAGCRILTNGKASCPSSGQSPNAVQFVLHNGDDGVVWTASAGVPVYLYGGDGADQLNGAGLEDLLDGGPGNDTLNGLGGNDFLSGGDGNDTTDGGEGDDDFESDDGNDSLLGGSGDDYFDAGSDDDGNDAITGGTGDDTTDYHLRTDALEQMTLDGLANDGWWTFDLRGLRREGDNLATENVLAGSGISQMTGDAAANLLVGNGGADTISGGDGNDELDGGAGGDTLNGQAGDDTLTAGEGIDTITGGTGKDWLEGGAGADNLSGEAGDDQLQGGADTDVMNGGDGADMADYATHTTPIVVDLADPAPDGAAGENDVLTSIEGVQGGQANDQIRGDDGPNTLLGAVATCAAPADNCFPLGDGVDVIEGRGGNDTMDGGIGDDTLLGGEGDDRILENVYGGTFCLLVPASCRPLEDDGDDLVDGGAGGDLLGGGTGSDTVLGGEGDDLVNGGPGGDDQVLGGAGADRLFGGAHPGVGSEFPACSSCLRDLGDNLLGGPGADELSGGAGADVLDGEAGNDTLFGETGDDVLKGGPGGADDSDTFYGDSPTAPFAPPGSDTVDYADRSSPIQVSIEVGADDGDGAENDSVAPDVERVLGGGGDDDFLGNANPNVFVGNAGDDSFTGLGGNDTFDGGEGTDSLAETGGSFTLTDTTLTGLGDDSLVVVERVTLTGSADIDDLDASLFTLGPVFLDGQAGNDTLMGGARDDELTGGAGVNALNGGGGADTVVASGDVNFTLTDAILTGPGVDALTAIERARLTGGEGANTLDGSAFSGSVALEGGGGDDALRGGAAPDVLGGGAGNDALNSRGGGPDTDSCGDGNDSVISDLSDSVGSDCESNDSGAPAPGGSAIPTLVISNARVKEGNRGTKAMTFLVRLSAASATPVTVRFKTQKGTARPRSDFVGRSGTLTFAPGQTLLKLVVKIKGDLRDERNEKFKVLLANVVGGTLLDAEGVGTIRDNDP